MRAARWNNGAELAVLVLRERPMSTNRIALVGTLGDELFNDGLASNDAVDVVFEDDDAAVETQRLLRSATPAAPDREDGGEDGDEEPCPMTLRCPVFVSNG
jgi:hypothetical protein